MRLFQPCAGRSRSTARLTRSIVPGRGRSANARSYAAAPFGFPCLSGSLGSSRIASLYQAGWRDPAGRGAGTPHGYWRSWPFVVDLGAVEMASQAEGRGVEPRRPLLRGDRGLDGPFKAFRNARRRRLEGIVAKRADSRYRSGLRTRDWLKIKTSQRQEAVIVGFTPPHGARKHFGALVLAVRQGSGWRYAAGPCNPRQSLS